MVLCVLRIWIWQLNRQLKNFQAWQSYQQAIQYTSVLMEHPYWSNDDLSAAVDGELGYVD